ncbi:MAG: thiolase family protein [Candidatus Melainabacteria bacterium]|nr:thiolase family protein [Candidatus Melainabacteria bacterium]
MSREHITPGVVIVDAVRTPTGRYNGALASIRADDLAALTLKAVCQRNPWLGLDSHRVEEVLLGCGNQGGEDCRNVARMAVLLAELPHTVAAGTVNRLCGSGMMAIQQGAMAIMAGQSQVVLAGGVESMSRSPYAKLPKHIAGIENESLDWVDTTIGWRFTNPRLSAMGLTESMAETAERVAQHYGISRHSQDAYTLESHRRACQARANAQAGIVPIETATGRLLNDEPVRDSLTIEALGRLKPLFSRFNSTAGTITAGNASGLSDGASILLLSHPSVFAAAPPQAHRPENPIVIRAMACVGHPPLEMGMAAVPAIEQVLQRAKLTLAQMDLIELNEAFAATTLACCQVLELDPGRINQWGGALALGSPLGAISASIVGNLFHQMRANPNARYGLAATCVGLGQGLAIILERLERNILD